MQINSLPFGANFQPQNQDPTARPSAVSWDRRRCPTDLLRPFQGYGDIRLWDYSGYGNYNGLQTSVTRRFDSGFMFSGFWVWSKALGINSTDFAAGVPNLTADQTKHLDYSLVSYDRTHNIVLNAIYQTPTVTQSKALGLAVNNWQLSGVYRWSSGQPYAVNFSIPGIGSQNLTGTNNPNARIVVTCDPGKGYSGDVYQMLNPACFAPPQPGSKGDESSRFFVRNPPTNNLDLSLSKNFAVVQKREVRVPGRHVQRVESPAVHGRQRDRQLRQPDRSDDHQLGVRREREPGAAERVRDDQRRGAAAHAAARHPRDVLTCPRGSGAPALEPNLHRPAGASALAGRAAFESHRPRGREGRDLMLAAGLTLRQNPRHCVSALWRVEFCAIASDPLWKLLA